MGNYINWTALMHAARHGHFECAKVLAPLEKGITNKFGVTAFYYTIEDSSTKECAEFLWQFPEERETKDLEKVQNKSGSLRVSCADGTCIGAGSLLTAAFIGCP